MVMPFADYKYHVAATLRPSLLWEYDMSDFDWQAMRDIVVQRVLERGRKDDYYAMLNMYGLDGVREALRNVPYMNDKDMNFACHTFNLKKKISNVTNPNTCANNISTPETVDARRAIAFVPSCRRHIVGFAVGTSHQCGSGFVYK